jgi:hypothetical protein
MALASGMEELRSASLVFYQTSWGERSSSDCGAVASLYRAGAQNSGCPGDEHSCSLDKMHIYLNDALRGQLRRLQLRILLLAGIRFQSHNPHGAALPVDADAILRKRPARNRFIQHPRQSPLGPPLQQGRGRDGAQLQSFQVALWP